VKVGDFIFCLFDVEETPRTVGLSPFDGMITGAYTVVEPGSDFDRGFLYYFYLNLDADKRMKPLYTGLRNTISKENFFSFKSFIPPKEEQTLIAQFLDRKTTQIDQAIAQKVKQIELLKERRQILIHKAVTRGINPNVKLKDSGVEWIGEIPEHWEVKRLKHLGNSIIGLTYSPNDLCDKENGTLVLRSSNLFEGKFRYGDKENAYVKSRIPSKLMIREDDILICSRNGSRDLIGKCALASKVDSGHSFGAFTTVFRSSINPYIFCILNSSIFKSLSGMFLTSTINQLTIGNLNSIQVPIPPPNEMDEIRNYVESINLKVETAISLKENEIEKLKEYKATIINSVVTGKIKV
jgi:type I restriction enzyme S subunit